MKFEVRNLSDTELRRLHLEKKGTPLEPIYAIELERRSNRKEFFRRDAVRWLALILSIISLGLGVLNYLNNKESQSGREGH